MPRSLVALAYERPDLRDRIDDVADLGWLLTVVAIEEHFPSLPLFPSASWQHNLFLSFVGAARLAGEELKTRSLAEQLHHALGELERDGPGDANLAVYTRVADHVAKLSDEHVPTEMERTSLIGLADVCLSVLLALEDVQVSTFRPVLS